MRVLVVDGQARFCAELARVLNRHGHAVDRFDTTERATEFLCAGIRPDLVLVQPGASRTPSGCDSFVSFLANTFASAPVPVVLVSPEPEQREHARRLGTGYFAQPLHLADLVSVLASKLTGSHPRRPGGAFGEQLDEAVSAA